jgi:hypothetical protein
MFGLRGDGQLFAKSLQVSGTARLGRGKLGSAVIASGVTVASGGLKVRPVTFSLKILFCTKAAFMSMLSISQILLGGETIKTGGLAVNDGGVVTKAPKGDLLAMYINATGTFTDSSLTIDGKQVPNPSLM